MVNEFFFMWCPISYFMFKTWDPTAVGVLYIIPAVICTYGSFAEILILWQGETKHVLWHGMAQPFSDLVCHLGIKKASLSTAAILDLSNQYSPLQEI